jgi:DNA-binding LytR/AlgR family response regulator
MVKTLIIEDEYRAADRMESLLHKIDPEIKVLEKLDSVEAAVGWFQENAQPDLLFADIQLADGLCFEIFDQIKVKSFIIFTTAYNEYAIRAFELNSIGYLLKPIDEEKLRKSLTKFRHFSNLISEVENSHLKELIFSKQKSYKKRFVVTVGYKIKTINTNDIAWFVSEDRITYMVTFDNQKFPIDFSLDRLEELLSPNDFFRINRQYLVCFESIASIAILSKSRIKLGLNPAVEEEVLVSSSRTSKFREWLDK